MLPAFAKGRHEFVEQRTERLIELAESDKINKVELNEGAKIGVIAAGDCYQYAKEALGENASYLKLGMVYPLPEKLICDFAAKVDKLYVIEELDDFIEAHCRKLGLKPIGKEIFLCAVNSLKRRSKSLFWARKPRPSVLTRTFRYVLLSCAAAVRTEGCSTRSKSSEYMSAATSAATPSELPRPYRRWTPVYVWEPLSRLCTAIIWQRARTARKLGGCYR